MTNQIVSGNSPYPFLNESLTNHPISKKFKEMSIRLLDSTCHTFPFLRSQINYYPVRDQALKIPTIIQEIALSLSLKESYQISSTSEAFSKALLNPNYIARRYKCWQTRDQLSSEKFIEAATRAGKCLTHINFSLKNCVEVNFPITAMTLTKLVTCCPSLRVVSLSGCDRIDLNTILAAFEKCVALQYLDLSNLHAENSAPATPITHPLLKSFKRLHHLDIQAGVIYPHQWLSAEDIETISHFSELRTLNLAGGAGKNSKYTFSHPSYPSNAYNSTVGKNFNFSELTKIQSFSSSTGYITDQVLTTLSACRELTYLDLTGEPLTGVGFKSFATPSPLISLLLRDIPHLSDEGLQTISVFTQLQRLELSYNLKVTVPTMQNLLLKLNDLQCLSFGESSCLSIDEKNFIDQNFISFLCNYKQSLTCFSFMDSPTVEYTSLLLLKNLVFLKIIQRSFTIPSPLDMLSNLKQLRILHLSRHIKTKQIPILKSKLDMQEHSNMSIWSPNEIVLIHQSKPLPKDECLAYYRHHPSCFLNYVETNDYEKMKNGLDNENEEKIN